MALFIGGLFVGCVIGFVFASFCDTSKCADCLSRMAYERFKHDTGGDNNA